MINILCLHGCSQTAESFRSIIKDFIRLGENQYDAKFFFLEGDYPRDGGKQWFDIDLDIPMIGKIRYPEDMPQKSVDDCLDKIHNFIIENNISVLFGFSQGGNVIDTYLSQRDSPVKLAVIFSGYSFVGETKVKQIPLINVYSEEDDIVLAKYRPIGYEKITDIVHSKGHKMPTSKPLMREILEAIKNV